MANVYVDRKMLKWLPFQSLPEQGTDLSALLEAENRFIPPTLSEDDYQAMQYRFEEAWAKQDTITVHYYDAHGMHRLDGKIVAVDAINGIIQLDTGKIAVETMTRIA